MPDYPYHIAPALLDGGLVARKGTEINGTESGLEQGTVSFFLRNEFYPRFVPARGTSPKKFKTADPVTQKLLADLAFLGKHTHRFRRGGAMPGVGILEILLQGAIFPKGKDQTDPFVVYSGTKQNVIIPFYALDAGTWSLVKSASVDYLSVDVTYDYVARERPASPLFISEGDYPPENAEGDEPVPTIQRVTAEGTTAVVGSYAPSEVGNDVSFDEYAEVGGRAAFYAYVMTAGQFLRTPAGASWLVRETGQVKIKVVTPSPLADVVT